jgi:hypothetical protein
MKKTRRFQDGGVADEDFTADQLKFLGGADRTDPYILARMRSKFPDAKKSVAKADDGELRDETGMVSKIKRNTETGELYSTEMPSVSKEVKKATAKTTPKPVQSKKTVTDINEMPEKLRAPDYKVSDRVRLPNKPTVKPDLARKMAERKKVSNTMDSGLDFLNTEATFKSGGKVSSASKRADGCAIRGKTKA